MIQVGVVIAARNPGDLLRETLQSVAQQTLSPCQLVVVDDGSDDGAAQKALHEFPWIQLMEQPPLGRSAARNAGAREIGGDALLFLDADDLLRPRALELLSLPLEEDPATDLVHGRVFEFVDRRNPPPPGVRRLDQELDVRMGGSTLLRRTLWERVGAMDESIPRGEWIDWISRADSAGSRAARIPDVVLERRLHSLNSSTPADDNTQYLAVIRKALQRKRQGQVP